MGTGRVFRVITVLFNADRVPTFEETEPAKQSHQPADVEVPNARELGTDRPGAR